MIELAPRSASPIARFGGQPIAIAAAALVIVVLGVSSIALWRAYTGNAPETDRVVATRQLQARATQASEQLVEKTKGLEATQQESIDQLQMVQDQLQTVRRLLAAQQTDSRKLSEQVGQQVVDRVFRRDIDSPRRLVEQQDLRLVGDALREALLQHSRDLGVQLSALAPEQRIVGGILHQRVLEGEGGGRGRAAAIHQPGLGQVPEGFLELLVAQRRDAGQ